MILTTKAIDTTHVILFVMTLLIAFKLARRDFLYWIKVKSKPLHFFASLLARVGVKIMLDFTGSLLLRHPYEFGGAYYSFTLITTPLLCFYFGSRYLAYVDDEEVSASLDFVLQTICYISFLAIIEPKYRKTFLGTTTASQMTMAKFQETRDDHVKLEFTFDVHPSLWAPIKDEVKNWVNEALGLWMREQPDWFDDHAKASIPDNFVTDKKMLANIRSEGICKERSDEERERRFHRYTVLTHQQQSSCNSLCSSPQRG